MFTCCPVAIPSGARTALRAPSGGHRWGLCPQKDFLFGRHRIGFTFSFFQRIWRGNVIFFAARSCQTPYRALFCAPRHWPERPIVESSGAWNSFGPTSVARADPFSGLARRDCARPTGYSSPSTESSRGASVPSAAVRAEAPSARPLPGATSSVSPEGTSSAPWDASSSAAMALSTPGWRVRHARATLAAASSRPYAHCARAP